MKQKVMVLCAFLIQPSLYIIDEPFLGLDPLAINALLELMVTMKEKFTGNQSRRFSKRKVFNNDSARFIASSLGIPYAIAVTSICSRNVNSSYNEGVSGI
jgi:ABC-type taurine transport system ATPase subunit